MDVSSKPIAGVNVANGQCEETETESQHDRVEHCRSPSMMREQRPTYASSNKDAIRNPARQYQEEIKKLSGPHNGHVRKDP
ncbi:MAG: hypothetical protein WA693_16875, partial [Pseudolabrys sp.]